MSASCSSVPACHHCRGAWPGALICLHVEVKLKALTLLEAPELDLRRAVVWVGLFPRPLPTYPSKSVLPGLCQERGLPLCPQD